MGHDTEHREAEPKEGPRRPRADDDNEIGYRNVDEEGEHDESGSQGPGREENPPREH
jgi:hypothetical protein